jgi:hypothetical protein
MSHKQLIEALIEDCVPVQRLAPPRVQLMRFSLFVVFYLCIVVSAVSLRADLSEQLRHFDFYRDLLILSLLSTTSGLLTLSLARPGVSSTRSLVVIAILVTSWVMTTSLSSSHEPYPLSEPDYSCARLVILTMILLGGIFCIMLKSAYCTRPKLTALLALLTCSSVGGLSVQIVCPGSGFSHLFYWHLLPVLIGPLLGGLILARFLRDR